MRRTIPPAAGLAAILISVCVTAVQGGTPLHGSGNLITKQYDLGGFTDISVGSAFQAEITQSDHFSVEITADDNLLPHIRVNRDGRALHIAMEPNFNYSNGTTKARITLPRLEAAEASGATRMTLQGFRSDANLKIVVSGASNLSGSIEAADTSIEGTGASTLDLHGAAQSARLTGTGASRLKMADFNLGSAHVELTGASSAAVKVNRSLGYRLSGASSLRYSGNPTIGESETSGASSARREH